MGGLTARAMPEGAPITGDAASPCTGVCAIDAASGYCTGCARTLDEIAAWGTLPAPARRAILAALPARMPR